MRKNEIRFPQVDAEGNETLHTADVDSYTAFLAGREALNAHQSGRCFYHRDRTTGEVVRLTAWEITCFGAGTLDPRGIDYAAWRLYSGQAVNPSRKILRALARQPLGASSEWIKVKRPEPLTP